MAVRLIFLGTGGGRYVTVSQWRWTGGIRFIGDEFNIHLDPGPGALIRSIESRLNPGKVNVILISHAHPDHYTDAEVMIEAMTGGAMKRRGLLIGARSVLFGNEVCDRPISTYHKSLPAKVVEAKVGEVTNVSNVTITATKAVHSDPDTVGFKLKFEGFGEVGYTSDTEYYEGLSKYYDGVRVLLLCTLRPSGSPWKFHLSTDDAIKILEDVKPEVAITTHFGGKMLRVNPFKEAKFIEDETGVRTIAAADRMEVTVGEEIKVSYKK